MKRKCSKRKIAVFCFASQSASQIGDSNKWKEKFNLVKKSLAIADFEEELNQVKQNFEINFSEILLQLSNKISTSMTSLYENVLLMIFLCE